jgi:hypothetical protein
MTVMRGGYRPGGLVWGRAAPSEAGRPGGPLDPPPLSIPRLLLILQGGYRSVGGYTCVFLPQPLDLLCVSSLAIGWMSPGLLT